ncbi:MAG: hypothetical protein LC800_05985 [Acidobacteria bacterium]|nr:hypothetical protein [Acidobacteriota bacterium]
MRKQEGYVSQLVPTNVVEVKYQRVRLATVNARVSPQIIDQPINVRTPGLAPPAGDVFEVPLSVLPIPSGLRAPFALFALRLQTVGPTPVAAEGGGG